MIHISGLFNRGDEHCTSPYAYLASSVKSELKTL
jgi:hypothetical protein